MVFRAAIGAGRNRVRPAAAAATFGAALAMGLLSALLSFASAPLYDAHLATAPAWGLTALADQQAAAAIMRIPGGLVYLGTATVVVVRWLRDDERRVARSAPGDAR